ncbi:MAG: hypothetical protein ACW99U_01465 [Candidatus Thorarchaeota archaeon]|jgi:tRNA (guanine10-N2)-dimethyltransferase
MTDDVGKSMYFVLIIGEDLPLAQAEQESLVKLVSPDAEINWRTRLGLFESSIDPVAFLASRSAMAKESGVVIHSDNIAADDFLDSFDNDVLESSVGAGDSFCVRTVALTDIDVKVRLRTESRLGTLIGQATGARVCLENPDVRILVVFLSDVILVCKSIVSNVRSAFRYGIPERMPFFHPSMMNTELSRVLCNLAGVMPHDVVLDPFCGAGGILSEVLAIGAKGIGIDLNWGLLRGARLNLAGLGDSQFNLIQSDARRMPIDGYNHIVTDPPYGRASSTRGAAAKDLVKCFLENMIETVRDRGTLCMCGSVDMSVPELLEDLGLSVDRHLVIKVHSGLTREIVTVKI